MWWKRRPNGGSGFPRRPVDAKLQRNLIVLAVLLSLIYPLWGLSVLVVIALDHLVIRRVTRLRRLFGMRDRDRDRPSGPTPEPSLAG
jgi:uncharacterized iron-regulated membrane protein